MNSKYMRFYLVKEFETSNILMARVTINCCAFCAITFACKHTNTSSEAKLWHELRISSCAFAHDCCICVYTLY